MSYSNKTHVILLKDENGDWKVRTEDVCLIKEDEPSKTFFVYFENGFESKDKKSKLYQYPAERVVVLSKPVVVNPCEYNVFYNGKLHENVYLICHFNMNPKLQFRK